MIGGSEKSPQKFVQVSACPRLQWPGASLLVGQQAKVPIRGKILPLNYRFSGFSGKLAIGRINRVENARGPVPESAETAFAAIPVTFKRAAAPGRCLMI